MSVTDGSSMLLDSMVTKISDSAALSLSGEGTSSTLKNGATLNVTNATVSVADKAKLEVAKSNVVLSSNAEMKVDNGATVTLDKDSILSVDDSSKLLIAASTTGGKFVNNGTVTLNGIFETDRNSSASECSDEAVGIFENRGTLDINSGSTNHNVNNGKLVNYSTVSLNGVIENGDHCIHNMKDATFTIDGEGSQIIGGSVMNYGTMNALVSNAITGASVVNTGALWLTDATGTSHGTLSKLKSYNDTNGTLYVSASALSAASTYDKALISGDASVASNIFTATDRSTQIFVVGDTSVRSPYEFDTAYGLKYVYAMDSDPGASPVAASIDDLSNPDLSVGRNATGENAYIYSYNGFIKSTVTNGVVDKNASVNGDYVSTLSNLTNVPQALVYNMLMNGYGNTADTGYKYIHEALFMDKSSGDYGRYVEVPTRLMAYSGFYQSAMQILAKTSESVNSHLSGQGIAFDPKRELGLSLWMVPFFAHQENDGFGAGNLSYDSKVNIRGVTIGMDRQDDEWIYGGFLNLGSSCSAGERLAAGASAEYDFWGLGLYGHYTHDKFRLDGQAGITFMHGTMEYDTPITGFGTLSASPDLKMWDAELTASYGIELNSPDWELRPSAGIKFRHFDADDYDLNSEAGTILHTSPDDINQWIAPVRVALSHDFDTDSQWHHTIKVDAGIDFVLGDVKSVDHSSYYGFEDVMSLNTEIADHEIFRANAGWSFSKEHFLGRISAGIGHSEHMDEYSISGELRYQF